MYEVYVDGSCLSNPGPGGWGMVVYKDGEYKGSKSGGAEKTTNNEQELMALKETLSWCVRNNVKATIYTDSAYCLNGYTQWMHSWSKKAWKGSSGSQVKNKELWKEVYRLHFKADALVTLKKVKAHSGVPGNERADALAKTMADEYYMANGF